MGNGLDPITGTPEPELDGSEDAGTPEGQDDGEAGDDGKVTISKGELGVWKSKAERVNAAEAEVARLRALVESRTTTDDKREPVADEDEAYLREIEAAALAGDKASKAFLAGIRKSERLVTEARAEREMAKIPEADVPSVEKFMREKGVKSPAIAHQFLKGEKYSSLEAEVADLRAKLADKTKTPPAVDRPVRGETRQAPSKLVNGKEVITLQEYTERMNDPARRHETKVARDGGKLTIRA